MIIGHHLMWSAYGYWLPNDPRGSSSHGVRVEKIGSLGPMHYGRKPVQPPSSVIREFQKLSDEVLEHRRVEITKDELLLVGEAIGEVIAARSYTCFAAAIMPDHVHLLVRRHRDHAEVMIEAFQQTTKAKLIEASLRPTNHPVWGGPGWKVFQNTPEQMAATIEYIRRNPLKIGWLEQHWDFVTSYDGWLPRGWKRG
jgi:REP element-mobilizing transposase RayT